MNTVGEPEKFSVSGFELIDNPASGSAHTVRYVLSDGAVSCAEYFLFSTVFTGDSRCRNHSYIDVALAKRLRTWGG